MVKPVKDSLKKVVDEVWSRLSSKLAGKADKNHTHAAQTSVSGNAGTATKLQTARKIGNANFDGSANITLEQMGAAASGHTHGNMTAATASVAGKAGLVPAPAAGAQAKYLRGDGTWQTPPDTNTVYTHPTTAGNKHIPAGGSSGQILRWSSDGTAAWGADNNTTYGNMKAATASAAGGAGLVPAPAAGAQAKYLRGDGTWQNPPNTTYGNMTAATASVAGKAGLVPAPAAGAQAKYLRGDGTWQTPPDTNTVYTHPTGNGNNHLPADGFDGTFLAWKSNGTGQWIKPNLKKDSNNNVFGGGGTCLHLTTGKYNVGLGTNSLTKLETGTYNVAIGYGVLGIATDCNNNVAIGYNTCKSVTTGYNVAIGSSALTTAKGDNNVAIGSGAGNSVQFVCGDYNTFVGATTTPGTDNCTNTTVLGYGALSSASNQIVLGNGSITQLRCKVTSIASLSDKRVKEDIHPADTGICLKDVLRLPITRYKYKDFTGTNLDNHVTGWMADDYEKVFPKGVQANDEMFPVLDENGNETFEEVMETRKTINPETGEEKEVQEVYQQRKMFKMEKVKTITPTEALPTLWGAVQELAKQMEDFKAELNKLKTFG